MYCVVSFIGSTQNWHICRDRKSMGVVNCLEHRGGGECVFGVGFPFAAVKYSGTRQWELLIH